MGTLGIPLKTDDGVYEYICTIYTAILKQLTQHVFVSDSHFSSKKKRLDDVVQSLIIYHMHPSMYWKTNIEK